VAKPSRGPPNRSHRSQQIIFAAGERDAKDLSPSANAKAHARAESEHQFFRFGGKMVGPR